MTKFITRTIGTKDFHGEVDITDPCYGRDVWCRMNNIKIADGTYICNAYVSERISYNRIDAIGIFLTDNFIADSLEAIHSKMKHIGNIGVDAGLAGFFHNKPDYDDDQWTIFCDQLKGNCNAYINEEGFFSTSGDGDGSYDVYAYNDPKTGEIVALAIDFTYIDEQDDNEN